MGAGYFLPTFNSNLRSERNGWAGGEGEQGYPSSSYAHRPKARRGEGLPGEMFMLSMLFMH